jgi:molybdate transport system ATP-binding protein
MNPGEHWALIGPPGPAKTAFSERIARSFGTAAAISSRYHFRSRSNQANLYYQQRFNASDSEEVQTVAEYLAEVRVLRRRREWTEVRVVERLRLGSLLDKPLILLSNGETKRLLFASSLLKNPELLLLDHPFTGLDVESRTDLNVLFNEIIASGIHICMSTEAEEIPEMITHIAVFDRQGIVKTGPKTGAWILELYRQAGDEQDIRFELSGLFQPVSHAFTTIAALRNVTVRYGDKTVLNNVSWQIRPGERWALSGANGSGKSTLLSLINGDNPQAYANEIVLFDRKRGTGESIWDIKRNIGFVSPELFQYFPQGNTCLQVVESGFYDTVGLFRRSDAGKARTALRWLQVFDLGGLAAARFRSIAPAEQRLCLLARALVKNPPLLIFDEPCQGLDPQQQRRFKQIVNELCSQSDVTLIYVSHYEKEIPESVTKTLKLTNGIHTEQSR